MGKKSDVFTELQLNEDGIGHFNVSNELLKYFHNSKDILVDVLPPPRTLLFFFSYLHLTQC